MENTVAAIVTPVVESLMAHVKKHIRFIISYTKYVRDMDTEKGKLDAKRLNVKSHMERNKRNNFEVPPEVGVWLEEVGKIDVEIESSSTHVVSCFNIKARHMLGKKATKIIQDIDHLTTEYSTINWTDHPIALGKVDSMKGSTSRPSTIHNDFKSRERTFVEALKSLEPNHKSHMIALCGMGGVGKTTMMKNLKEAVIEKKMFSLIVTVVIGENTDVIAIQDAVADYLGIKLTKRSKSARADRLSKCFEATSEGSKKNILIILDDVWKSFDLNDVGLSPLPNEGVGFKFLLTSRDHSVCTMMGVEADSFFMVDVIEELEAQSFFHQFVAIPNDDLELQMIGKDIVRKCCGLPIAIRTIAYTLKDKSKDAWKDALSRLEHHDINGVLQGIFEISYKNIQDEETKSLFLLCGLFPEDFDIPKEELLRYGWGLELFNNVDSIIQARTKLNACLERLVHANLLIQDQDARYVKMHDLVYAFVLGICSKGEHTSIVGDMSKCSTRHTRESCKRISLTCRGMSGFPKSFKCPNLSLLKLMHGGGSLKFPNGFYETMEKLKVIAYEMIRYPLLPKSLECSKNLRTLCLHQCLLISDCSSIGNISNLEVLSFAHCHIQWLPSAIGKLKKLKLLDLTGCVNLRIDDGVLKNLVKLEELYMRAESIGMGTRFTNSNSNELVECSKNLTALEIEFFQNNLTSRNMSYMKLERFNISFGCSLTHHNYKIGSYCFENRLTLVTNKCELLEYGMNELFGKTKVLALEVHDINDIRDIIPESLYHHRYAFYNLRVLIIYNCADMRFLFTTHVANGLTNLERLAVTLCPVLDTLVDGNSSTIETIKLPALKFLSLYDLPKLMSLCNTTNVIELLQLEELELNTLPNFTSIYSGGISTTSISNDMSTMTPLLNKEVVISELKTLKIYKMDKLKGIWPSNGEEVSPSSLRRISVEKCNSLVNLFPTNPMSLLPHLEDLQLWNCDSIEVLFNIDVGCDGKVEEVKTCLKRIGVMGLDKLREVWRIKGATSSGVIIHGFEALEHLEIQSCKRFKNVFKPITTNFVMRALTKVVIDYRTNILVYSGQEQQIDVISVGEISKVVDIISGVAFPSYLMHTFLHVDSIHIGNDEAMELVFEIENPSSKELATTANTRDPLLLPYLKDLKLRNIERMSYVWKCIWNKVLISQNQGESLFHNLTTIRLEQCKNIKYLFSPLMVRLLLNLKTIDVGRCDSIEEIVSNENDEDEETIRSSFINTSGVITIFPHLDSIMLDSLPNLKCIGDGVATRGSDKMPSSNIITNHDEVKLSQMNYISWSFRKICMMRCDAVSSVIPSSAFGQMQKLEILSISHCKSMEEVFETQGINNTHLDQGSDGLISTTLTIPRVQNVNVPQLSNIKKLNIDGCDILQHVFTLSTLESLRQLKELDIRNCEAMNMIVKNENAEETILTSKVVEFPRLKSIYLSCLPSLTGFFLGTNKFQWPLLDSLRIIGCPQMKVFTTGHSISPKLRSIHTDVGVFSLECGLSFQTPSSNLEGRTMWPTTRSFHNVMEINMSWCNDKFIIPFNELLQVQKLKKISVRNCSSVEEVFEAFEGIDSSGLNELQSIVKIPNLRDMKLDYVIHLKHIWKNNPGMRLEFPNLAKVDIYSCYSMEHVFTTSMVSSLSQLQELRISVCPCMEVIVKEEYVHGNEEECDIEVNEVILPHLRSLKLNNLRRFKGFCLGNVAFSMPSLDSLAITNCPSIKVFTKGSSVTPELRIIETPFGACEVREDLNSFIKKKHEEGLQFGESKSESDSDSPLDNDEDDDDSDSSWDIKDGMGKHKRRET